jgi:hypothetical protein
MNRLVNFFTMSGFGHYRTFSGSFLEFSGILSVSIGSLQTSIDNRQSAPDSVLKPNVSGCRGER